MESLESHQRVLALSRLVDEWAEGNLGGEPNWEPLEKVIPPEWCGGFMWMQRIQQDGLTIEMYKHGITRRYLNLDSDGQTYRYKGSEYVPMSLEDAIASVFGGLEEMGWSRETDYDDGFVAKKYAALREAGWTVITTGPGLEAETSDNEDEDGDHDDCNECRCGEHRL